MSVPSIVGAVFVYSYFNYVAPTDLPSAEESVRDLIVFTVVTTGLVGASLYAAIRYFEPLETWAARLRAGESAAAVPRRIRRRTLNAPLFSAVVSLAGWTLAGAFYFPYQLFVAGAPLPEALRVLLGIVLVGGPLTAALSFLMSELIWRLNVPLFYPDGALERTGVLRVPILVRLGATFLITSVLPPLLMLLASFSMRRRFGEEFPPEIRSHWLELLRTQTFIVAVTGAASLLMAMLVARFISRPIRALRAGMAAVADGNFDVRVPVRSTDELGELNERFNAMVESLRRAERVRELFGRYVSRAVARDALERGVALGGELSRATAMFVDLRGFTAMTERTPAARVVEVLNEYYACVERVCEAEGGIITQFLGDGVVAVFGAPLQPLDDHALRAVRAAVRLQHELAGRNARDGDPPLQAGIGICTGDIIAGNVGSGDRVTYTIVGDAVNQAARLQVKTRDLDAPILVTESTRAALGVTEEVSLEPRGTVALKGITEPIAVYAVTA